MCSMTRVRINNYTFNWSEMGCFYSILNIFLVLSFSDLSVSTLFCSSILLFTLSPNFPFHKPFSMHSCFPIPSVVFSSLILSIFFFKFYLNIIFILSTELAKVPTDIPPDVLEIDLSRNKIKQLSARNFMTFQELETLNLSNNALTYIHSGKNIRK